MTLASFEKVVTLIDDHAKRSIKLSDLGVDLVGYDDAISTIISLLLRAYYGDEGEDWINWYIFERKSFTGKMNQAWDKDGKEICYDIQSLWAHVEKLKKLNLHESNRKK